MASVTPSKQEVEARNACIEDLRILHNQSAGRVTRDLYRQKGAFSEQRWKRFFSSFTDFLLAAGLRNASTTTPPKPTPSETQEVSGNRWDIVLPKTRICTLEELLDYCKVDLQLWKVDRFVVNKWEVGATSEDPTTGEKSTVVAPLFQVKATLLKRVEMESVLAEIAELKEHAARASRVPRPTIASHPTRSGNMLEVNIPDVHFGKLAWGKETGHENYDTSIAEETFLRALETIIQRSSVYKFDSILFVVGNDLLNSDDLEGRTTKGTFVSTDGRYEKTFGIVRRTITYAIERLRKIAPVKVVMVRGNHDNLSVWHLGDSLECYFAKYRDVEIDNDPKSRKYHQFGKVMLMFTHGDKGKRADYPLLMAAEQSEMFGNTKFREIHTGHTHMTKTDEQHGIRVRVLPALCPPDAWHAENGFVGNQRNAEGYIWNKEQGLIAQVFHNDDAIAA